MSTTWVSVETALPRNKQKVLCKLDDGEIEVLQFVKGISLAERMALGNVERKVTWFSQDEDDNNLKPYCWIDAYQHTHFGQEVIAWKQITDYMP